jgi:hypothetical protein
MDTQLARIATGVPHEADDGPGAACRHASHDGVRDEQRPLHRHVDLRRPLGGGRLEEELALRGRGVVDENVDRPDLALDALDGRRHLALVSQIGADREALDAERPRLLGGGFRARGRRVIVKRDIRALGGKREPDGAAEPLPRARDQNHLVGQLEIHRVSDTISGGA